MLHGIGSHKTEEFFRIKEFVDKEKNKVNKTSKRRYMPSNQDLYVIKQENDCPEKNKSDNIYPVSIFNVRKSQIFSKCTLHNQTLTFLSTLERYFYRLKEIWVIG